MEIESQYGIMAAIGSKKGDPISPDQAKESKENNIHPMMIEAVNELLAEKFKGDSVTFSQKEIVKRFMSKKPGMQKKRMYEEKHLDFEPVFRQAGWTVAYDKPAYNETYEPTFKFSKKG